ncbi:hypothetical protein COMNV_00314 [Commensalibacter sp. Nvir]|uniref:hypothetical protein n=1 Tax=Commensalibacter sp. Nvir TaxID=3069817 RepID=UPI002D3FA85C|nr:hypothetical protein COMNV_00314 [Commensalibacter sp. Nvir]
MIFSGKRYIHTIKSFLIPLFAANFLWGCAEKQTYEFPPVCPKITVLSSASDYYQFYNHIQDLSHLDIRASILGVKGKCVDDPKNIDNAENKKKGKSYVDRIDTTLNVIIQAQQGPAAQHKKYQIPYFIATIKNGAIVDKKNLIARFDFPDNVDQLTLKSEPLLFKLPSTPARTPDGYELFLGFQLTPDQLSYNRNHFKAVHYTRY